MIKQWLTIFIILFAGLVFSNGREWEIYDSMPIPVAGAEIVTYQGNIYIFGGYSEADEAPIAAIQMYDPIADPEDRWSVVGYMNVPRANFIARFYEKDLCVYIAGGTTGHKDENVPSLEKWNFSGATSQTILNDTNINRTGASGEIWQNYFIIIGGYNNSMPQSRLGLIAVYDLDSGQVRTMPPMPNNQEQYNHASVIVNGSIFLFGGVTSGISKRIYHIDLENLTDFWPPNILHEFMPRIHPDLEYPRSSMDAVVASSDTIWLIGGYSEDSTALRSTNKFVIKKYGNSKSYEHQHAPPLVQARKELVAAKLRNIIYVFGGVDEHGRVLNTVEAYQDTESSAVEVKTTEPLTFQLQQNYPNPFNASTTIEFELEKSGMLRLEVFDAQGRWVTTMMHGTGVAGSHRVVWDGRSSTGELLPSGIYLYKLSTEDETQTRKMLLVK